MKHFISTALVLVLGILAVTQAQVQSSQSAIEGSCISPPVNTDLAAWVFIFTYTGVWNIPMASEYLYRRYAEILTGSSAASPAALASMNLQAQCTGLACVLSGYTEQVTQVCIPTSYSVSNPALVTEYTCPSIFTSTAVDWADWQAYVPLISNGTPSKISVLWTDLTNTLVLSQCLDGGNRAFAVFSKSATLDSTTQTAVNNVLTNAGYNPTYFQFL